MCGICGIAHSSPEKVVSEEVLIRMRDTMVHRGPDDAGCYLAPGIALGVRRLSILDLSEKGHMPMSTPDGRYVIVHNGEVYNYRELRKSLEGRGYSFRSNTDTEVLLGLHSLFGTSMLDSLNGMFAFAIWDREERSLFLARDRLGIKPLYYAFYNGAFFFASEEKALFAACVPASFDFRTWEELVCFRYVAGEQTPFTGARRLLPGHYLVWRDGGIRIQRWWNLAERARALRESLPPDPVQWFGETFDSAVGLRRISDVPLGVLLSGGVDSSSVAASLSSQVGPGVASFTVRFAERGYDEGPLACEVARRWQLDCHELQVSGDRLLPLLESASWLNDEPLAHGNALHLLAISRYAKPRVTVLLSGEGGDETLGGYLRYRPLRLPWLLSLAYPLILGFRPLPSLDGRMRKLGKFLELGSMNRLVLYNSCDVLPADLLLLGVRPTMHFPYREQILAEARALYPGDLVRQAMYGDQHAFLCSILDRNDRMTMGASIECRVPFLDYRLVEGLAALPTRVLYAPGQPKRLLHRSLGTRLPQAVRRHHKWGFGVPWSEYLRQFPEFVELVNALSCLPPMGDGVCEPAYIRGLTKRFLAGDDRCGALVWQLVMIAVWYRQCLRPPASSDQRFTPHILSR